MNSRSLVSLLRPSVALYRPALPLRASFHASFLPRQEASAPARVQLEDRKLQMTFTCTAPSCSGVRSTHEFSRQAYESGIVLVQCPGCKTRHLIADHLGWFKDDDLTKGGQLRTIEDLMRAKGETVKRGILTTDENGNEGETISFFPEDKP